MTCVIPIFAPEHRIKSVTIFKSTNLAEVVRTFDVELKPGQTKIEITGLPSALQPESVRVTGLGSGSGSPLRLFDVVCTISSKDTASIAGSGSTYASMSTQNFLANIPTSMDSAERIRLLKSHLTMLESKKRVREHESDLLVSYAKTLNGEHINPEQMTAFLSTFVESGQKSLVAARELDETMVEVQRRIAVEQQQMEKKKGNARAVVDVVVGNGEKDKGDDRKVELKLTYIVANATWEPTYELHAQTSPSTGQPSSQVTLHYRASIVQSTGEDWTDSALTLSSGSSFGFGQVSTGMPALRNVKIKPLSVPTFVGQNRGGGFGNVPPQSNIFGNRPPNQGGIFGNPVQTSSAFGSTTKPASGFGAFGQPASFSFSGATTQSQSQPQQAQTSGLFGQPQQQQQAGGGLFGGGSLFGAQASQPAQQQQAGGGLFGGGSSFGAQTFGGGSSAFSSEPFGAPQQAAPQSDLTEDFEEINISAAGTATGDVPLSQTLTVVTETPVAISYSVEGRVSIPSDGVKHQVGVAVLPFGGERKDTEKEQAGKRREEDVKIEYGVVPRVDTRVYLDCRIKNTSEYRLLPGSVSVIFDDTYVARTNIGLVNPNDTFTCTLGSDPTTSVTYMRSSRNVQSSVGSFTESFNTTTHTTTVTLLNRHTFDLKEVRVRDAVPMWTPVNESEKNRIGVVLKKPQGLADVKDGQVVSVKGVDDKERSNVKVVWEKEKAGMFSWKVGLPAGKKETLVLEWEVKAPVGYALAESFGN